MMRNCIYIKHLWIFIGAICSDKNQQLANYQPITNQADAERHLAQATPRMKLTPSPCLGLHPSEHRLVCSGANNLARNQLIL